MSFFGKADRILVWLLKSGLYEIVEKYRDRKISLIVIGGGRIADSGINTNSHIPISLINGYSLQGILEPDLNRANELEEKYACEIWGGLESLTPSLKPDLIVISSPSGTHLDYLFELSSTFPFASFLVEKPLTFSSSEVVKAKEILPTLGQNVRVNYSRNYSDDFYKLKHLLKDEVISYAEVIFSGGLLNSGSHFLRLLSGLFNFNLVLENQFDASSTSSINFTLRDTASGAFIKFKEYEFDDLHFGEIFVITNKYYLRIDEGSFFTLFRRDKVNGRKWPRNLEVDCTGNFNDGFKNSYENKEWLSFSNHGENSENLLLDLEVEGLIHKILSILSIK